METLQETKNSKLGNVIPEATFGAAFGHGWKYMMKYFLELDRKSVV